MSFARIVLLLTLFVCISSVKSSLLLSDFDLPWNRIDDCKNTCDKSYEDASDQANSCSRGCRFYSMAEMIAKTTELDLTIALKACTSSCQDSYPGDESDRSACQSGCDSMSKLRKENPQQDLSITSSSFSFSFFFDDGNGLKSLQSDGNTIIPGEAQVSGPDFPSLDENKGTDLETDDVLTDPALRGQAGLGFFTDIKLPIMKVKTLPVEEDDEEASEDNKVIVSEQLRCWWLPAIVVDMFRYIPACLLFASLLLLLVLLFKMAVLVCATRKSKNNVMYGDDCFLPNNIPASKYALFVSESNDNSLNSTFVKVPPPKYDDVIVIDSESKMAEAAAGKPTETI